MTPSFLETEHRVALLGTPGGSRIITAVLLAALSFEQGGDAGVLVGSPRFHHQFLPDRIELEPGRFSEDLVLELQWLGHEVQVREHSWGNMQAVVWDKRDGRVEAASDPRGIGSAELLQAAER